MTAAKRELDLLVAVQQAIELLNHNNTEKANKTLKNALKKNFSNS
jgi:Tfp pilus assembly protein PilF